MYGSKTDQSIRLVGTSGAPAVLLVALNPAGFVARRVQSRGTEITTAGAWPAFHSQSRAMKAVRPARWIRM